MFTFYRFSWSKFDEDLELDSGKGVYYVTAGVPYNIDDMKNIVSKALHTPADSITINSVKEISKNDYEAVTKKTFDIT